MPHLATLQLVQNSDICVKMAFAGNFKLLLASSLSSIKINVLSYPTRQTKQNPCLKIAIVLIFKN
jgi:hypothetical protein